MQKEVIGQWKTTSKVEGQQRRKLNQNYRKHLHSPPFWFQDIKITHLTESSCKSKAWSHLLSLLKTCCTLQICLLLTWPTRVYPKVSGLSS